MLFRQGDVFLEKIREIPAKARGTVLPHGTLVYGEVTGHSHRLEDLSTGRLFPGAVAGAFFLEVMAPKARIVHEEHGPIDLGKGFYRVWRQREYSPEAIRPVCD
jgi:hypothetical protein